MLKKAPPYGEQLRDELRAWPVGELARRLRKGQSFTPKLYPWLAEGEPDASAFGSVWDDIRDAEVSVRWVWSHLEALYDGMNATLGEYRSRLVPPSTLVLV